ncbi:membrane protein insertion efficiency factor YidD [Myxococcota bacterium]|nr:membrane protein insertion efficiency factor YidD [Myxococcota bacterium]MBU1535007.1 membrane protein insertion efficiency factor YidD [Myxococcota bacterium]
MARIFLFLIGLYQKYLSPLKKHSTCKYLPTCSQYGIDAIKNRGALEGLVLTVWRVLRCNPFSKGGYDPAPLPRKKSGNRFMKRSIFSILTLAAILGVSCYALAAPPAMKSSVPVKTPAMSPTAPAGMKAAPRATAATMAPGTAMDAKAAKPEVMGAVSKAPAADNKAPAAAGAVSTTDATPVLKPAPAVNTAPPEKTIAPAKPVSAAPVSKFQSSKGARWAIPAEKDKRLFYENNLYSVWFTTAGAVPSSLILKKKQYREYVVPKDQLKTRKGKKVDQQMDLIKTWSPPFLPFQLSMTVEKTAESISQHTLWDLLYFDKVSRRYYRQDWALEKHTVTPQFTEWTFILRPDSPCDAEKLKKGEMCYPFEVKKVYRAYPNRYDLDLTLVVRNITNTNIKIKRLEFQITSLHEGESDRTFFQPVSLQKEAICYHSDGVKVQPYDTILNGPKKSGCMGCGGDGCSSCGSCSCQRQPSKSRVFSHGSRWAGIDARYFLLVLIKNYKADDGGCSFWATSIKESSGFGVIASYIDVGETTEFAPQKSVQLPFKIYAGPKDMQFLEQVKIFDAPPKPGENIKPSSSPKLEDSIDFGLLAPIGKFMIFLLKFVYKVVGNWGLAIIFLTMLIKLATLYFTNKSMRSMKRMAELKPEMDKLQKLYANDKEKLNQEMMGLYKKHGVNPLGGCLPMFLQMPIYIAWYQALMASVELYRAPLFGWINDLTARDPYFVLPILMGVTMFIQQKMSPTSSDNPQAKMMLYMMPIMFTGIMLFLPSGLTLYILTNTVLSLTHQWYLNHTDVPVKPKKA